MLQTTLSCFAKIWEASHIGNACLQSVSHTEAEGLIKITDGGFRRQHMVLHTKALHAQRLLLYGLNPHVPGLWCLQFMDVRDGKPLASEWRYLKHTWSQDCIVTKAGFVAWQVISL